MTTENVWRERMEDLASAVWTTRKASWVEVCEEVAKFTGKPVPEPDVEKDALAHLDTKDVQKCLVGLEIDPEALQKHGALDTELCPECFAMPGECEPTCGQYEEPEEEPQKVDLPTTEEGMVSLLDEALHGWLEEYLGGSDSRVRTKTFAEDGVLTDNKGLVVKIGRREFQITVVRSK